MKTHAIGIDAEALTTRKNPSKENEPDKLRRKKYKTIPGKTHIVHNGGSRHVDKSMIANTVSGSSILPRTPLAVLAQYD